MVRGKEKAVSFWRDMFWSTDSAKGPEEMIATKNILYLIENIISVRGKEELEIEEYKKHFMIYEPSLEIRKIKLPKYNLGSLM